MLKFTTTHPINPNTGQIDLIPLITPEKGCHLMGGKLKGKNARITGKALSLAGYYLPCFYDGDIEELDRPNGEIIMVLPDASYSIKVRLEENGEYLLDLTE
ncbi:MAG: hypothetical protein K2O88_08050 [Paramuribaculum sp.]|nr:hypothetical protein [Paramuribaculum sp.]